MREAPPSPVQEVDEQRAAQDIGYFMQWLGAFVGYTDGDRHRVLASATVILPHTRQLLDNVYARLLAFSPTRKFFVGADGQPTELFLEKRRKTLFEWLAHTAAGYLDARLGTYLEEIARAHVHRSEPEAPAVPLEEILALFGILQAEITTILARSNPDAGELESTLGAWNKMMAAQQAVFARVYRSATTGDGGRCAADLDRPGQSS